MIDSDLDEKNIYLTKGDRIIGLHAVGYKEIYTYEVLELDGSISQFTTDFLEIHKWGNEYDKNFKMIGRGSFRIHSATIDIIAKELEEDGWIRF